MISLRFPRAPTPASNDSGGEGRGKEKDLLDLFLGDFYKSLLILVNDIKSYF